LGFAQGRGPGPDVLYLRMDGRAAPIIVVPGEADGGLGEWPMRALEHAGVSATVSFYEGGIHGFLTMPTLKLARRARTKISREVAQLV
jgi:acetyl esterase